VNGIEVTTEQLLTIYARTLDRTRVVHINGHPIRLPREVMIEQLGMDPDEVEALFAAPIPNT
jgi:hypothetical protein